MQQELTLLKANPDKEKLESLKKQWQKHFDSQPTPNVMFACTRREMGL